MSARPPATPSPAGQRPGSRSVAPWRPSPTRPGPPKPRPGRRRGRPRARRGPEPRIAATPRTAHAHQQPPGRPNAASGRARRRCSPPRRARRTSTTAAKTKTSMKFCFTRAALAPRGAGEQREPERGAPGPITERAHHRPHARQHEGHRQDLGVHGTGAHQRGSRRHRGDRRERDGAFGTRGASARPSAAAATTLDCGRHAPPGAGRRRHRRATEIAPNSATSSGGRSTQ